MTQEHLKGAVIQYQEVLSLLGRFCEMRYLHRPKDKIGLWKNKKYSGRVKNGDILIYSHEHPIKQITVFRRLNGKEKHIYWTGSAYEVRKLEEWEVEERLQSLDFSRFTIRF